MDTTFNPAEIAAYEHATWSRCAPGYRNGFAKLTGQAIEALLDTTRVGPGSQVLEVGAGTADLAAAAAERGAAATAIDFSENMVAEARRAHPDLDVRLASAESLPFDDGSYDVVLANCVLHHLADPSRALTEARRVLIDTGRAAFTVWAAAESLDAFGLFFAAVAQHGDVPDLPHGPLFGVTDPETFDTLFEGAGFQDVAVTQLDSVWSMATVDPFLAAFGAWADLDSIPVDTRNAIEATVRERSAPYKRGDRLVIPNPMLLITASA